MKKHPNIDVKLVNVPYADYFTKLETMIAGGSAPDMVFVESAYLPRYGGRNIMTDLTNYVKQDKSINLNDFFPKALELFKYKGRLFGIPNDVALSTVSYNKNLFDSAGLAYPKDNWTKDDMADLAKRLTKDINGDGKIDQWGICGFLWEQALYSNGGDIADDTETPRKSTLNSKAAIDAFQWMADLRLKYKVFGGDYFSGKAAMNIMGHWEVPNMVKLAKFKWDVVETPTFKQKATVGNGSAFMIPANSKHKKEAWELIKFYSGVEGQKILARDGFSTPALRTIAESDAFLKQPPYINEKAYLKGYNYLNRRIMTTQWSYIQTAIEAELNNVWSGKKSVQQAMTTLTPVVTKLLERDKNR